jgi:pilus assembly protein CpaB
MLGVAILMGGIAVALASNWLVQASGVTAGKVIVTSRSIEIGTQIRPDMLQVVDWPGTTVPAGHINDMGVLVGRVVKVSLERGEPVLENKLAPVGARAGLAALIDEGKRAVTVKVNEVIGVAGFALPGTYVDVLVNTQDDNQKPFSKIVLERVLVLAVAQEASRDDNKPKVVNAVTVELTPEQVERLDLARSIGSLSLVLRNQLDKDVVATVGARRPDLLGPPLVAEAPQPVPVAPPPPPRRVFLVRPKAPEPAPAPPPAPVKDEVEVIKGTQKSTASL